MNVCWIIKDYLKDTKSGNRSEQGLLEYAATNSPYYHKKVGRYPKTKTDFIP